MATMTHGRNRLVRGGFLGVAFLLAGIAGSPSASAQTCGSEYIIKEGDSLGQIAARVYGKHSQWTVIFYANQDRLGANASLLVPGLSIRVPCLSAAQQQQDLPDIAKREAKPETPQVPAAGQPAFVLSQFVRRIEFLTADGYAPFTGRALRNGGMLTHVVDSAMKLLKEEAKGRFEFGVSWVNDWAAHLNPLLVSRAFDVGFPWVRPDCENFLTLDQDGKYRCQKFFFSDPLYEVLTQLFVRQESPVTTIRDESVAGKTLCVPVGNTTAELDQQGRNWVKDNKIVLIRPQTTEECFRLLESNTVDAAVLPDLAGRGALTALGISEKIRIIEQPLAISTLHLIVTKTHPHARTILYYINSTLARLREVGEFDKIVEEHLARFWEIQSGEPPAGAPPAPGVPIAQPPAKGAPAGSPDKRGPAAVASDKAPVGAPGTAPKGPPAGSQTPPRK
ncbi:MAG: hypothetical protein ACREC6_14225 [Hyphomicrobiaceae bacterium]